MRLAIDLRPGSPLRCAVCHDAVVEGAAVCTGCRPKEALEHYRAGVAANEVSWTEHDWSSCRLAQRAAGAR